MMVMAKRMESMKRNCGHYCRIKSSSQTWRNLVMSDGDGDGDGNPYIEEPSGKFCKRSFALLTKRDSFISAKEKLRACDLS